MRFGEAEEDELPSQLCLHALARRLVGGVPLVDGEHYGTAALEDVARDMRVLLGDALRRIDEQHGDVRRLDRLQRLDDGEILGRRARLAAPADAGGVDQR